MSDDLTKTRPSILVTSLEDDGKFSKVTNFPTEEKRDALLEDDGQLIQVNKLATEEKRDALLENDGQFSKVTELATEEKKADRA